MQFKNIKLHLDPFGSVYGGTAELYIGSAVSGSVEKAHEMRLQVAGVIPFEVPIPIEASAAVGIRTTLRVNGKEGFRELVDVGYSGGSLGFHEDISIQLGTIGELDHEAFLRIEVEAIKVCDVIWPFSARRLWDKRTSIGIPFMLG